MTHRSPLKKRRQELDLSQTEVAVQSDISQSFYSQIEKGHKTPSKATMERIANTLQSDVATLFFAVDITFSDNQQPA